MHLLSDMLIDHHALDLISITSLSSTISSKYHVQTLTGICYVSGNVLPLMLIGVSDNNYMQQLRAGEVEKATLEMKQSRSKLMGAGKLVRRCCTI
jgi:hypothetical protein